MEQHPIPRQITTFEFKLIGFMTLKQFIYLLIFIPSGFVVFKLFPIPIISIILGLLVVLLGVGLAFFPINDRPMDVWIKNLFKRLNSPTQFTYHKNNSPLYFLQNLYFLSDPHKVISHVESKEKLAAYLQKTQPKKPSTANKNQIQSLLRTPTDQIRPKTIHVAPDVPKQIPVVQAVQTPPPVMASTISIPNTTPIPEAIKHVEPAKPIEPVVIHAKAAAQTVSAPSLKAVQHPFFTGIVKNNRQIPLPGVLVYIKDQKSTPLRLLKTNPHGIFATYNPLPDGEYDFEIKDPNGGYNFDTMKMHIPNIENKPYEFYSKEMM